MKKILLKNIRYFTIFNELKDVKGGEIVEIQILKTGERDHPDYGPFTVDTADILEMKRNFDNKVRGIDIAVDENHDPDHRALGRYKELYTKNKDTELRAKIELTELGADILSKGSYKYFSPEICWIWYDEERGITYENVLIGGGFTNRPFFKEMSGIIANESAGRQDDSHKTFLFNEITHMEKLKKLLEGMKDKKIASFSEKFAVQTTFNELPEAEKAEVQTQVDEVTARPETEPTAPATTTPTQGESVKEGGEGEGEGKEDPKPTESAEFKEIAKENKELKARLDRKDTEELFNERFAYSEKNKKGLFNSETQKEAFIKFHLTLNEEQKKQFKELIYGIDTKLQLAFKEVGSKEDVSSENMVEAIKKIQAEKSVDYAEATKIYRETYK